MKGVNKVTLIGTTGKAAELRYFDNGNCIATCSMATNDYWTDKKSGQKMERTEWHNLIWRSKSAEIAAQYVGKGRRLYIEGQIQSRMARRQGWHGVQACRDYRGSESGSYWITSHRIKSTDTVPPSTPAVFYCPPISVFPAGIG